MNNERQLDELLTLISQNSISKLEERISKSPSIISLKDTNGKTLLHFSAEYGKLEITSLLIRKGISIYSEDYEGKTALRYALSYKHFDIADLIAANKSKLIAIGDSQITSEIKGFFRKLASISIGRPQIIDEFNSDVNRTSTKVHVNCGFSVEKDVKFEEATISIFGQHNLEKSPIIFCDANPKTMIKSYEKTIKNSTDINPEIALKDMKLSFFKSGSQESLNYKDCFSFFTLSGVGTDRICWKFERFDTKFNELKSDIDLDFLVERINEDEVILFFSVKGSVINEFKVFNLCTPIDKGKDQLCLRYILKSQELNREKV